VPHNPALSKVASGDRAERVCPILADVGEQEPDPASATCNPQPVTCNQPRPHCRAITTNGHRCRNYSLDGLHLCYSHFHHRHPALADKDHISVPLLEDHASIQLVMTQIVHGLLSMKLEPARARTAIWAAQVAAYTLPRPARLKGNEPQGDPVHRIGADHDGLISADPDPAPTTCNPQPVTCNLEKDLNYLCQVTATADEVWALQDRDDLGVNQPPPEQRYIDPWHAAPPPQPFPGWNVPPPPPPPPPPAHESGLPCDCPKCVADEAFHQKFLDRYYGRTRKRSAKKSGEDPDFNPLCKSGKPTCLGPDSEFCCKNCLRIRKARLASAPPDDWDQEFAPADELPAAGCGPQAAGSAPQAAGSSGVIPETQYQGSPTE
jgi:hypothetical protein